MATKFKDNAGRQWTVEVHVANIRRVRKALGIELNQLIHDGFKPLGELLGDPVRLVDVLYCLCQEQAETAGVSDEQFGSAFCGDVMEKAADAFVAALAAFFPADVRESVEKVIAAGKDVRGELMEKLKFMQTEVDPKKLAADWIAMKRQEYDAKLAKASEA